MAIPVFLAMTAAEFQGNRAFPGRMGWLACHFSPYSRGLSNLPEALPPGSLLIVDDVTPVHDHDPDLVAMQLSQQVQAQNCTGVLLDFQRPENPQAAQLVQHLASALPCPMAVSDIYAAGLDCPVFLSPVPPDRALTEHIAPWTGREIWLDLALDGQSITLTEAGAKSSLLRRFSGPGEGFSETTLHCHYRIETTQDKAVFTLWRTREDLDELLKEAEALGIATAVGLYQELM